MKISKLLNRKYLSIIIAILFAASNLNSEEQPVDIWNIDKENIENSSSKEVTNLSKDNDNQLTESDIYNMQNKKEVDTVIVDESLNSKEIKIIGLYDPEDYDLQIDMWSNSDGDQLKYLFSNLSKIDLSEDAADLMNISILTNAYYPNKNITNKEFLKIKSDWLIRNKDFEVIEEYLLKNKIIDSNPRLTRYVIDQYLSMSEVKKACNLFLKNSEPINDEYLSKFNLYCLINEGKIEEAQLILDLKKEIGFEDEYFEKKINFLFGFTNDVETSISEKSILDFHLAHRTNLDFYFEPKENTNKLIWKYLASSNLLFNIEEIEITQLDKISLIETATNDKNYPEKDLFEIYKRFQFNINQLLNAENAHKTLVGTEARALVYQRILLESEVGKKLELISILKELFEKDNYLNAFDKQLKQLLEDLDPQEVPPNFATFYKDNLKNDEDVNVNIKLNNDILHQSKLINYFNGDYTNQKIEKDLNNFLKKIKKNKKYNLSKKDIILLESLKSDGIKISKKYDDLYETNESEIPTDIQVMINNNESGATLLRIIEVIGQDNLEALDEDTLYFIISALNQLNIDYIRNKILLKVLPLKV